MSSSALTLTLWSRLLLGTLARLGIRDVIVSPGSRSTPLAYAALTTEGLVCHSIWDERCAAFFGLGQARVTGTPSLLICTSGSAAAHYYPAVVEASASFTPLLLLTADRPFELSECGAPQAMDQAKLYGGFVRGFFELGHPDPSVNAADGLERMAAQAVRASLAPSPGPVHLNARVRKPLEPVAPSVQDQASWDALHARLSRPAPRLFLPETRAPEEAVQTLAGTCARFSRGLIVCGPVSPIRASDAGALGALASATGYPICVEATSQARFADVGVSARVGALDAIFQSRFVERFAPDLVLQFGAPPTSGPFASWLASSDVPRAVLTAHGHLDPQSRARWLVSHDAFAMARAIAKALEGGVEDYEARMAFATRWQQASARYFELAETLLRPSGQEPLSEPCAVRKSVARVPASGWLGLGNSLPVRDVDSFVPPGSKPLRVWSQRGLNGIDGLVSGAIGAACAAAVPSLLLIGDVSFLHDVGGLAAARSVSAPLAIVVIDNGGGQIFKDLPVARLLESNPELAKFWITPPEVDLSHAAALYRLPYSRVLDSASLDNALDEAFARTGVSLIHAQVDPNSTRRLRNSLQERFDTALEADLAV